MSSAAPSPLTIKINKEHGPEVGDDPVTPLDEGEEEEIDGLDGGMYEMDPDDDILLRSMSVPTSRTAPFNAELGLLSSLKAPRNFHKKIIAGKDLKATKILSETSDLSQFHVDRDLADEEYRESIAAVRSLDSHKVGSTMKSTTNFELIKTSSEHRKSRHDAAMHLYLQRRTSMSESLEQRVLETARNMKESLAALDSAIASAFAELDDDSFLVTKDHSYVLDLWDIVFKLCDDRKQSIVNFGDALDKIEQERSHLVSKELQNLVTSLVGVGYVLLPEVERLAEAEANEVNLVIITNRRAHADLLARLMKDDVAGLVVSRTHWEKRQVAWRMIKHKQAISRYSETMRSHRFTNPPERVRIFQQLRKQQIERHNGVRIAILDKLKHLLPPNLTSENVNAMKMECDNLNEKEEESNASFFQELQQQRRRLEDEAVALREELRAELHIYGALAPEPNLIGHQVKLGALLSNPDLEDFFRKSGSLKSELKMVENTVGKPALIYQIELQSLASRLDVPIAAFNMEEILDAQGKVGEKRAVQTTLEKIRVAPKSEMAALVQVLLKQTTTLSAISGLHELVHTELLLAIDSLNRMLKSIPRLNTSKLGKSKPATTGKSSSNGSRTAARPGSVPSDSVPFDMVEMRSTTKRIGLLICSSDLPAEIKEELLSIKASLALKAAANTVVDVVAHEQSFDEIAKRMQSADELIRLVGLSLQERSVALHEVLEAVVSFYKRIAAMIERHEKGNLTIDKTSDEVLNTLLDGFDESNDAKEKELSAAIDDLRHAPNTKKLEENFAKALSFLESIETGYRKYYADAIHLTGQHPAAVQAELTDYRDLVCNAFGLKHGRPAEVSSLPDDLDHAPVMPLHRDGASVHGSDAKSVTGSVSKLPIPGTARESRAGDGGSVAGSVKSNKSHHPIVGADDFDSASVGVDALDGDDVRAEVPLPDGLDASVWVSVAGEAYTVDTPIAMLAQQFFSGGLGVSALPTVIEAPPLMPPTSETPALAVAPTPRGEVGKSLIPAADTVPPTSALAIAPLSASDCSAHVDVVVESLRPIPTDEDGNPCSEALEVPLDFVKEMLFVLRSEILNQLDVQAIDRTTMASNLKESREKEYTEELEERLRKHWPRRGRTDVMSYQPREGELTIHKQRYERHVRNVLQKNTTASNLFDVSLKEADEAISTYVGRQEALENALEIQTNLATLQGVFKKGKDTKVSFKSESKDWVTKLTVMAKDEPERLLATNPEFIQTCKLFEDGGDYNAVEVREAQEALNTAAVVVEQAIVAREEAVAAIKLKQKEALSLFTKFSALYEQCLQDLSMRDGLGQKYGAPRRNAQDRLRAEFSASDAQQEAIEINLAKLKGLCEEAPGSIAKDTPDPLSVRIRKVLLELRGAMVARAMYLEFVGEGVKLSLPYASVEDDPPEDPVVKGSEPLPTPTPFTHAAEEAVKICKSETQALYASEGKTAALGSAGMPDALRKYLEEQMSKASAYRESSARTFREQVEKLSDILLEAPSIALVDIKVRSDSASEKARMVEESRFMKSFEVLELAKAKHKQDLKPNLSNPNEAVKLEKLVSTESERCSDATRAIETTLKKLLLYQKMLAEKFANKLLHATTSLLVILDSIPASRQLGYLPGDENIVHKRKGMKRLLREAKKREEEVESDTALRSRDWAGVDLSSIDLPAALEKRVTEGGEGGPAGGAAGAHGSKVSESVKSLLSSATRATVKTRNACYAEYVETYQKGLAEVDSKYTALRDAEDLWKGNWSRMVDYLRKQKI